MLKNKNLLVDQDCPMCVFYGDTFTKTGLISEQTVKPYQIIETEKADKIDMERAKSEIALFDNVSEETLYGVDALIKIVSHNNNFLNRFIKSGIIYQSLKLMYKFISYNRKVIFPTKLKTNVRSCSPAFNINYRLYYIIASTLFVGLLLSGFAGFISENILINNNWSWEFAVGFGQIFWQIPVILFVNKTKLMDYLGNMCTISLVGSLALLPILIINMITELSLYVNLVSFGFITALMFYEHIRRCYILELPLLITASWALYRVFVLSIILISIIL
ncbi:MAG: hypothetical protein RLN83_07040 [Balneola sp.]